MGLKQKKAGNGKTKSRPPEVTGLDDVLLSQLSPTREDIERRAHEIYLARGAGEGRELDDWLQAERDLQQVKNGA
jgi:hypothetical protein